MVHRARREELLQPHAARGEALLLRVLRGSLEHQAIGLDAVAHERRTQRVRGDEPGGDVVLRVLEALLFGEAAAAGRNIDLKTHSERGRDGHTGARKPGTIGFASLRGGNVAGEHSVIFAGADERVELTHKATDRMIFARGALHAALWMRGRTPGLYSMLDVLGLKD